MFTELKEILKASGSSLNLPFPSYRCREKWESIPVKCRQFVISRSEEYIGYSWPCAPASMYLEYTRNGNRSRYEDVIFKGRRLPLYYLVVAECFEGKGRFVDDIINGIWTTLDEASWVVPAHNNNYPLFDCEKPYIVDLFAAECASLVSWVLYVLGNTFDAVCPQINSRIKKTLNDKIFIPFIENNFWWMGIDAVRAPNNWNPWIISNILSAVAFASPERSGEITDKCLVCLDNFVKYYAPDGGCDEGPGYWTVAGASLFDCIDIIYDYTDGKANLFGEELVSNMCSYIYKMHIDKNYYVCYADAQSKITPEPHLLYRMGQKTGDENLSKMGSAAYQTGKADNSIYELDGCSALVYRTLKRFFCEKEISGLKYDFPYIGDAWFEGIQVMTTRSRKGTSKGLFFSAKGGNNNESHNHNDIGSFIIYCDGKPAIIDIGKGEYVKDTFSERRYTIPQMQSGYHNLPIIGGITQKNGMDFAAINTQYSLSDNTASMQTDLKCAYPPEAGIKEWVRKFTLNKDEESVTVADTFELEDFMEISFVLMSSVKPSFENGRMTVATGKNNSLSIDFDASLRERVEIFDTSSDPRLNQSWGECVYRSILTTSDKLKKGNFCFTFTRT